MAISRGLVLVMLGASAALAGCGSRDSISEKAQAFQVQVENWANPPDNSVAVEAENERNAAARAPLPSDEQAAASDAPATQDQDQDEGQAVRDHATQMYVQQQQMYASQQAAQAQADAAALANSTPAAPSPPGGQ